MKQPDTVRQAIKVLLAHFLRESSRKDAKSFREKSTSQNCHKTDRHPKVLVQDSENQILESE